MKKNAFVFLIPFLVFVGALVLRVLLINWTLQYGNNGDFTRYEDWARIAHIYTFADTYTTAHLSVWKSFPNNQPPGSLYILSAAYEVWIAAGKGIAHLTHTTPGSLLWVNTLLQHIVMKIPAILSDMFMGFIVYLLVAKEAGKKKGILAASLVLFNPVIWYNSAIWGQMDACNNFFFILALFFAFRKQTILSVIAFAASLFIKLSLLPLLPFYFIFLYVISGKDLRKIVMGSGVSIVGIILATIPVSHQPVQWLMRETPIIARGEIQSMTVAAFNFWFMITCSPFYCSIPDVTDRFVSVPLSLWAYGIFALVSLPILFYQIKKPQVCLQLEHISLLFSLVALVSFLFLPGMHDRYMYPVFALLAMAVVLSKKRKAYFLIFCLLALFQLDNIVYSWYPVVLNSTTTFYHIFYGPVLRWIISVLTVIVAVWLYIRSLREWKQLPIETSK